MEDEDTPDGLRKARVPAMFIERPSVPLYTDRPHLLVVSQRTRVLPPAHAYQQYAPVRLTSASQAEAQPTALTHAELAGLVVSLWALFMCVAVVGLSLRTRDDPDEQEALENHDAILTVEGSAEPGPVHQQASEAIIPLLPLTEPSQSISATAMTAEGSQEKSPALEQQTSEVLLPLPVPSDSSAAPDSDEGGPTKSPVGRASGLPGNEPAGCTL